MTAAPKDRPGLGPDDQKLYRPRPGAPDELVGNEVGHARLTGSRLPHEGQRVPHEVVAHRHRPHSHLERHDVGGGEHRPGLLGGQAGRPPGDLELLVEGGIADEDLEHEAILLRLRERVGALLLDWVLGGEHEERIDQRVADPADAHVPLLHRLEQRRLRLGGRAVDLVGEHDVGEQRSFEKPQRPLAGGPVFLEHLGADDVGRHQVGGELDPREGEVEAAGEGAHEECLREAGNAFKQAVAATEKADQQLFDHVSLPHDDPGELLADGVVGGVQAIEHRGGGRVHGGFRGRAR